MAQSMAQMQQLLNSMTPEQRAQLQELAESLLEDMDLRWQVDQLVAQPAAGVPATCRGSQQHAASAATSRCRWGRCRACSTRSATSTTSSTCCATATQPGELAEVDLDRARELLGDDAARSLDRLRELAQDARGRRAHRAARGPARAHAEGHPGASARRRSATSSARCCRTGPGRHEIERAGAGHERAYEHKPYEFGDPFHLNVEETVQERDLASGCGHAGAAARPTTSRSSAPSTLTRSATVLMLDVSLSMPMRDNFLPAKKVAMALHTLITTQFPRDYFGLVCVRSRRPRGEARAAARDELGLRVGHEHAARVAARPPAARPPERHEADHHGHRRRADRPHRATARRYFQYPPSPITIEETLKEVHALHARTASASTPSCSTRATTCSDFVERMMEMNRGRAFFTDARHPRRLRARRLPRAPPGPPPRVLTAVRSLLGAGCPSTATFVRFPHPDGV